MHSDDQLPPPIRLQQLIIGKWVSQAIYAAAELGIADLLKDGARSSDEIAHHTGTSPDATYRLMRALGNVGVLAEEKGRRFALTDTGELLRRDVPGSLRGLARFVGHEITWKPWGNILESVRTGEPTFDRIFGVAWFDYVQRNPGAAAVFDEAMTSVSGLEAGAVASAYDFSGIRKLMDVGGGYGRLLATLLNAHSHLEGILFDMPHVLEGARRELGAQGIEGRCRLVGGSFFESLAEGADACILKHIIHDWDDEAAVRILRSCRRALPNGGKLLVAEVVLPPPGESHYGKLLDLEMLVLTPRGRERTEDEFRRLFEASGFALTNVVPTLAPLSLVEGSAI